MDEEKLFLKKIELKISEEEINKELKEEVDKMVFADIKDFEEEFTSLFDK